jgi:hypothetical protein
VSYPAEFELAYEPDYYRFMSATFTDGFASIYFDVSSTNIYANGEEARDSYLSSMSGSCMYTAIGDDWFAINNDNENGTITYIKGFVRYGYISTMTFSYSGSAADTDRYYTYCIEYMEDNYTFTKPNI